jgi:hypothetical protein
LAGGVRVAGSEFREYENGVADVLASVVGEGGVVRRNVMLPTRDGKRRRQIDVLVEGTILGLTGARLIVDCKRWKTRTDVGDVDKFIGMVEDVGAVLGILVSAVGATSGAAERAEGARGVRIKPLSITELNRWRPAGTVFEPFEIDPSDLEVAAKYLREAGLRVEVKEVTEDCTRIEVFRHYGTVSPSGDMQREQHDLADAVLSKRGIAFRPIGTGVTIQGGTPNHRWIEVHFGEGGFVMKVLADSEAELDTQLEMLTSAYGVPRAMMIVKRPDGWPSASGFPFLRDASSGCELARQWWMAVCIRPSRNDGR